MLDDLWELILRILLYPCELIAEWWFTLIEWIIELMGNSAPDVMPSIPDAPQTVSWPRVGLACALGLIALSIVNGALAGAVWLGLLHVVVAYLLGGLLSLALLGGTMTTLFRLIVNPPKARPRNARSVEQDPSAR